ncbi:MAG: metallophosphoesterase family protein [Candidatus Moranbacteria bacterium]|jgi:putative phosphoesterase|nr:metallophosphoesterase family protein [Candidatus Moranbacteria bacterium]MDX9855851.1 metallophosphoesterase family protein [Candidatus Moranbacteria bacterium]
MRVIIISDVHNNTTNLKKVLDHCADKKIKEMICCGDLASQETLDFLCDNFSGEIYYTFGNMESGQILGNVHGRRTASPGTSDARYKNVKIFKDYGEANFDDKKVAFVHYPDKARELCKSGEYEFVFHGHTHKPWVAPVKTSADQGLIRKCTLLNPGNVANEIYPPTFAVWDTENDNFELIRINDLR